MPVKRMQSSNTSTNLSVSPQQSAFAQPGVKPSPSLPSFTRSASPSGLSNFFSRPTKWFSRTSSGSRVSPTEPRASTSSTSSRRRPTISGPTDPRPIETISSPGRDNNFSGGLGGLNDRASRSVLDLSSRSSMDLIGATPTGSNGSGDLRSISRKGWSRSVDNLQIVPPRNLAPLNTTLEMKIEQYRTGTPSTPGSINHKIYPFPTMPGTPSTPPNEMPIHQIRHVHSHSGSNSSIPTIASPSARLALPIASPQKATRKRSFDFDRSKGKSVDSVTPPARSGAFSFYFGGNVNPERKNSTPVTPTPPTIIEPEPTPEDTSKRASQIVHRSGFINRLQNYSLSSPQLSSNKNWKPFKMVLKGSKIYFHKPPGDRVAAIKELFPSGLVALIEEEAEEEEAPGPTNKDREEVRKKRAFWGRRTHPGLAHENGKVVRGSLEALVHECVFGTTFFTTSSSEGSSQPDSTRRDFISSILLCVPYLVERTKFEYEFQRCAGYFVSGAEEKEKDACRAHVAELVSQYLAYHVKPADVEGWEKFCKDTIPSILESSNKNTQLSSEMSPNLDMFSPRPNGSDKFSTLSNSMRLQAPASRSSPASPSQSVKSPTSRVRMWSALEAGGFTREIFFNLEPETVARSLLLYQRSILEAATSVSAEVLLGEVPLTPLVEFFGCDDSPHWLTRTVVMQILGPGHSQTSFDGLGSNAPFGSEEHVALKQSTNSRTHVRSEVIGRWARVGEMSRLAGDECSWRAIKDALCSKPIARLEKAWRRVDSTAMNVVRAWVYSSQSSEHAKVAEPRVSPWGGDGRYRVIKLLEKLQEGKSNEWQCDGMYDVKRTFDEFSISICACRKQDSHQREASEDEDAARLLQHWKDVSKNPLPTKIQRINQLMSLSFAAEPRKKGLYAPYYWSRQAIHGPQVLVPLLVPEVLPTVTFIDRSQIVRVKKTSYESSAVLGDPQVARPTELKCTIEPDGYIRSGSAPRYNTRGGNAFDLGGMILPVFDGELLLCVVSSSEANSRPESRADNAQTESSIGNASPNRQPSIRVKSAAAGLDRKSSRARRASLPALSHKTSAPVVIEQNGEPPLHAVVQAGTLDALVHFLIHGLEGVSVSVADDNGEMALRDKKTRAVKVDRAEFARIWWPAFRSFVSPYVLFQLLRKDFMSSTSPRSSLTPEEAAQTIYSRQEVLRALAEWIHIGGGAQDTLDDIELHSAIQTFLEQQDERELSSLVSQNEELSQLMANHEKERVSLLHTFIAQTLRPSSRHVPVRGQSSEGAVHNFGIRAPKLEEITPLELVDNLDAMGSAAFRNVNQEDLYVTVDLLEVQTSDRTGWYLPREPTSVTDEVEVQSLYSFLMEVEPSSLTGEYSGETLYRLLPPGVRSLIRAYTILRRWAVCSLAVPQLGQKARQARMEMFLKAIEICRLRSVDPEAVPSDINIAERPCVRSFVEAVLTSAVISPESRMFSKAWQNVASARNAQVESILSLLSVRAVEPPIAKDRLTVDPAWILERMLEIISLTDVLDSPMDMETPLSLVNFDKRRQISNVIANASSYANRGSRQRREMDRMDFERLNRIEQEFGEVSLDLRVLRDEAQRETMSLGPLATPSRKREVRPFQRSVLAQQEKIKRDRYMRERLMKEKRLEQQRLERKEDDLNRAMDPRNPAQSGGQKHQRGKRSMTALFSLMRPISTAFTSESNVGPKRSAAELDFTPTHKPALVLSLVDAHITAFINNERSFTFQIDTEDGGHYLLQALSKNDMSQWMQLISTAIRTHAQRRLTYLGNPSQLHVADHVQPRPITASHDPKAVFGVDLSFLLHREADGDEIAPDAVPRVLELCLKEIERRGLTEQGIYRVAGATSEVTALREALSNGQTYINQYTDINAVCGVVKYWFRVLPETLVPEMFFEPIIEAARLPDLDERLNKIREVVHLFPRAHFSVLRRLAEHMDRVIDYEDQNHMTPDNLAVVICPNLLRAPNNNFGLIMKNMGPITILFKALITHMHLIFDENDGAEGEEEEDGDEGEEGEEDDENESPEEDVEVPSLDVLLVPEMDLGPRFTASPEPDELLHDVTSSPES